MQVSYSQCNLFLETTTATYHLPSASSQTRLVWTRLKKTLRSSQFRSKKAHYNSPPANTDAKLKYLEIAFYHHHQAAAGWKEETTDEQEDTPPYKGTHKENIDCNILCLAKPDFSFLSFTDLEPCSAKKEWKKAALTKTEKIKMREQKTLQAQKTQVSRKSFRIKRDKKTHYIQRNLNIQGE